MGNGMNKVMPGLYIGNYRDSKDYQQLERYQITHIVSIHDSPRRFHPDKHYLCVMAADTPDQNLSQYFSVCNDFIHAARLKEGHVLIHCLAGMSRSVTVAVAYIMSVTPLNWKEALKVVRAGRAIANPNLGFQNQLQDFESYKLLDERKRLKERFPSLALESNDREQCFVALDNYEILLENKGVCEGQCKFAKDCPTGICRSESRSGLRRKGSNASRKQYNNLSASPSTSSQLSVRSAAQSCPTSPRSSKGGGPGAGTGQRNNPRAAAEHSAEIDIGELSELRRSSSIVSTFRPRSSPAGLYSYTGSAPPSIHGSRVDLASGSGSAIYLGSNSPSASPSPGMSRRVSLRSPKSTPKSTPDNSPKPSPKRLAPSKASAISTQSQSSSGSNISKTITSNSSSPMKTVGSSKPNSKPPIASSTNATKSPARALPSSSPPSNPVVDKSTSKSTSNNGKK
ncbi:AAEL001110-PA [Aedes aegypti]|uniref:Dual specificity protein phosphatase 15 n=1 Tax=Aedes aegypti TaxID=7159 RepID=Q17M44_AEDAE|nr:AAEL001110-PA [Aedes aegypti]